MNIALTGSIGSGKSAAAKLFKEAGIEVLDTDKIAHQILEESDDVRKKVSELLGKESYNGKTPNRQYIAKKVFSDKTLLENLEKILHPAVIKKTMTNDKNNLRIVEVPLLYEKKLEGYFDLCIVVYCSESLRFKRLCNQRGMKEEDIFARDSLQMPQKDKVKLANIVLFNEGDINFLREQVALILSRLIK